MSILVPTDPDTISYISRWGGRCRECADRDGVCLKGLPCDVHEAHAAIRHVLDALNYGLEHGYLAAALRPATDAGGATSDIPGVTSEPAATRRTEPGTRGGEGK